MNNESQKNLEQTLEQIKVNLEEVKIEREKKGTNHAKVKKDHDKLKGEVETLKKSFNGSDDEYQEYLKELAVFDKFRFLRAKNGTQLTPRVSQINLGTNQLWVDRAMPANFLHSFLTCLMNFDTPAWN